MSFLLSLLILLAPSYSAAALTLSEAQQVIFAQIDNSVTLPRKLWGAQDKIHVNWHFNNELLISRNPTSSSSKTVPQNWQGRLSLSPDLSLIISPVQESDFGTFKCIQHELLESTTTTYRLYQVTMPTPSPLLAGASLSLSCEIDSEGFKRDQPTISWFGPDNKSYPGYLQRNKQYLKVNNVSSIHNGKWTCQLKYGIHNKITFNAMTNAIIVDLAPSPPDPIYTFDSSSNLPIPCSLSSKIPWSIVNATGVKGGSWHFTPPKSIQSSLTLELHLNPSPTWKVYPGTQTLHMETMNNHELSVKIPRVSIKNRGTYTCSLEFGLITLSRKVEVQVLQVISSAGKVIYEGNTVNLTCTLGHPMTNDLEVNWIPPHGSSRKNLSPPHPTVLSIPAVRLKDSGRWICQLKKNETVLTSATISLKIEKAPVAIWLVVAIIAGLLVFSLLAVITVIIMRRRRQVMRYRRRKKRFCCCKNPQPKGFYKT